MEQIIDIIIKIVATLLAFVLGWLGTKLIAWLKTSMDSRDYAVFVQFVGELVAAAEQMYKQEDPDGKIRLEYVQEMLVQSGYEITDAVKALIESKVFEINLTNAAPVIGEDVADLVVTGFMPQTEGGETEE